MINRSGLVKLMVNDSKSAMVPSSSRQTVKPRKGSFHSLSRSGKNKKGHGPGNPIRNVTKVTVLDRQAMEDLRALAQIRLKVEVKEVVLPFRGKDAPMYLAQPFCGYAYEDTKESSLLRTVMSRAFAGREYSFRIATSLNMSSNGAGIANATISNTALGSNSDFIAISGVFNEFFVTEFRLKWEPVSMYNYPLTGTSALSVSSLPLGCSDLQHAQAAYTNQASMTENWRYEHNNTGRPFLYSWKNTEKKSSSILVDDPAIGTSSQSWCNTSNVTGYTGFVQFLTQSAPPALPFSQILGTFLVEWDVYFRVRL